MRILIRKPISEGYSEYYLFGIKIPSKIGHKLFFRGYIGKMYCGGKCINNRRNEKWIIILRY